jgi:Ni/Co efflux regulator RcnB
MNPKALVCTLVASSIAAAAGPAFGQASAVDDLYKNTPQIQSTQQWQARHGGQQAPPGMRVYPAPGQPAFVQPSRPQQQPGHPAYQQAPRPGYDYHANGRYYGDRGAGPDHNFYPGMRLPPQYRHHNYVVNDWRGHHLMAPPPGYYWVQTGGDYVLVAIATGLIVQLLLMNN